MQHWYGAAASDRDLRVEQLWLSRDWRVTDRSNSFLMLALLSVTGRAARDAGGVKNMLIAVIITAAVTLWLFWSA